MASFHEWTWVKEKAWQYEESVIVEHTVHVQQDIDSGNGSSFVMNSEVHASNNEATPQMGDVETSVKRVELPIDVNNMTSMEFQAVKEFVSNGQDFIQSREDLRRELVKLSHPVVLLDDGEINKWLQSKQREAQDQPYVLLDESEVSDWFRSQQRVKAISVKVSMNMDRERGKMFRSYVALERLDGEDPREPKRRKGISLFPERMPRQTALIKLKSEREVNRKRFKLNRKLNINKPGIRKQVLKCGYIKRINRKRRGDRPFHCTRCAKTYKHVQSLNFHYRDVHLKMVRYTCRHCHKQFLSLGNYRVHMRRHKGEKRFSCDRCAYSGYCQGHLNRHWKYCGKVRRSRCPICARDFKTHDGLRDHMITELSKRRYKCHRCGMETMYYGSIYKHVAKCMYL